MKSIKVVFSALFFFLLTQGKTQTVVAVDSPPSKKMTFAIINGDTVKLILLDEVIKTASLSDEEKMKYARLVRAVQKAIPYAKLAAYRLQMMEDKLALLTTDRAKRKYIKQCEKAIKEEFTESLKNLTREQGRVLMKLISRETGSTTWEIMKRFRGDFSAFFWQSFSKLYDLDMKESYDPAMDWQIENIIKIYGLE